MKKSFLFVTILTFINGVSIAQGNQWAWMKGEKTINSFGVYGTINIEAPGNTPGARQGSITWKDATGNFWLFGGFGYGESGTEGQLNDLWKFNVVTNQWTWVQGDKTINNLGIYGTINTPSSTNKPGARSNGVAWVDNAGNFWLYGGSGYGEVGSEGKLNDLWKYDITSSQWVWMKGDKTTNFSGVYGGIGISSPSNKPGSRAGSVSWTDLNGDLWLFGGSGYDKDFSQGDLNDLWKYNINNNEWIWMKGGDIVNQSGIYNSQNISSNDGTPGSRSGATGCLDASGFLWLFGGIGYADNYLGNLNDLWKYDPYTNSWAWISGDNNAENYGIYGTLGVPDVQNKPGSRNEALVWSDGGGLIWLFGGIGNGAVVTGQLNDLWVYSPAINQWACMAGENGVDNNGTYGTLNIPAASNIPGSRQSLCGWAETNGNIWLFAGNGLPETGATTGSLNDLWKFSPCSNPLTLTSSSRNFCNGITSITLTVTGSGSNFQWYKDDILIPGETNTTYNATSPGNYFAKLISGGCTVYSNLVVLESATATPSLGGNGVYCIGDQVNVGIPQTEIEQDYTWRQNGISVYGPIGGNGGNQSLNFNMQVGDEGTYIVRSSKPGCDIVFSNPVYVGIAIINNLSTPFICGDGVTFKWDRVAPLGISQVYQYAVVLESDPEPAIGINTSDCIISVSSLAPSTQYKIYVRATCQFGSFFGDWSTISFTTGSTAGGICEWLGVKSTDWSEPQNWKCGQVPVSTSEVVINGGNSFDPTITSNITIKKMTINTGATVNVSPGINLTVTSQ